MAKEKISFYVFCFIVCSCVVSFASGFSYPVSNYTPGSYGNRSFLSPSNHLGEDINLAEGTPVYAIGDGYIKKYGSASGYGTLVVVIEHDLGEDKTFDFKVGDVKTKTIRKFCSIYGHLKKGSLTWKQGNWVNRGDLIGYIQKDSLNGDGAEHLHFGIFADQWRGYYYGYTGSQTYANKKYYVSGKELIDFLSGLTVYEFWQKKSDATYLASCDEDDLIFDAQFKVKNLTGDDWIYVNKLALAVQYENGEHFFDMSIWDSEQWLGPGEFLHLYKSYAWIKTPGTYKAVAKAYYANEWHELASQNFVVINNTSCGNDASTAFDYIDKCINKWAYLFGDKIGEPYSCFGSFYCQDTDGAPSIIAIHESMSQDIFWYYWNGWKSLDLFNCD